MHNVWIRKKTHHVDIKTFACTRAMSVTGEWDDPTLSDLQE